MHRNGSRLTRRIVQSGAIIILAAPLLAHAQLNAPGMSSSRPASTVPAATQPIVDAQTSRVLKALHEEGTGVANSLPQLSNNQLGRLGIASLVETDGRVRERIIAAVGLERARRQRAWLQRYLIDPYLHSPDHNKRWEDHANAALEAAADYWGRARDIHGDSKNDAWEQSLAAGNAGCPDGGVQFIMARWMDNFANRKEGQDQTTQQIFIQRYAMAADALARQKRLPLLFARAEAGYVRERLREAGQKANGDDGNLTADDLEELHADIKDALDAVAQPLPDRADAESLVLEWWMDIADVVGRLDHDTYSGIKQVEQAIAKAGTSDSERALFVGTYHVRWAGEFRGTGFADTVTPQRQALIDDHLKWASDTLEYAHRLDPALPDIAVEMMAIERNQGQGMARLERWFEGGRALDASNYRLYEEKMFYLLPRYYGSDDEARAFGLWCLKHGDVNNQIPLLLADYRYREAELHADDPKVDEPELREPAVWADVAASYEPYLRAHPAAVIRRSEYLRDAYFARRWDVVRAQMAMLGGVGNFNPFGMAPDLYKSCIGDLKKQPPVTQP